MKRESGDYIIDIIEAIDKIAVFIESMDFSSFIKDEKTSFAVIRAIEVIGEASKNIEDEIKKANPEIPWKEISGMRDKLAHAYFGVSLRRVWETATVEIPKLKPAFKLIHENCQRSDD